MRPLRIALLLAVVPLFSGCGYVHFGRLPETGAMGDNGSAETIVALTTENKILKQELALVRRDGDTMRSALEKGTTASPELTNRLAETSKELAALRVSYARLQSERGASTAPDPVSAAKLSSLEDQLATSLRSYTQLQEENARLRSDLARARADNTTLSEQLKISTAQNEQAQSALAQLNTELLAHRDARLKAEQAAAATRAQLNAVVASGGLAGAREAAAPVATGLQLPSNSTSSVVAELRTNAASAANVTPSPAPGADTSSQRVQVSPGKPARIIYTVQEGDTLEKIALQHYGDASSASRIYAANTPLLRDGHPLKAGMELVLPPK